MMMFFVKKTFNYIRFLFVGGVLFVSLLCFSGGAVAAEVDYHFDEAAWSGTTGEVLDNSGNSYHATAMNGPVTNLVSPAISGSPGTCSYGIFDGINDYIALPSNFPDLTTDYTITAWIRTTDNTRSGQRILIDDPNNTQGFGFSLGDGGTGRVRFFSRSTNPISLDTPRVIENNIWYFVAAVADISNHTKSIYVYDQAGNQLTAVSVTYTGSWGHDAGDVSMGGENNSSGESGSNFHFVGTIDEVRVHTGALSSTQVRAVQNTTRICVRLAAEYRFDLCSETNTIIDDSGNGFNGTVINGPLAINTGKICNGADFDGIDDYIEIDDSNQFDNTGALTIAGWINPKDIAVPPPTGNARGIVSKRNTFTSEVAYGIFFYSSRGDRKIYVDLDTVNNRFSSISTIPEDTWTHFAVVFDGSLPLNQRAKLYINGVLDRVATESSTTIPDYNSNLYIGNLYTGPTVLKVYKGKLDEMRIIPAALSPAEVQSLFSETRASCQTCSAAVDHFRIEHTGSGLTCQPSSIEIRACADSACNSEFSDPVTVTLTPLTSNPPTWIGGDTQTFTGHQTFQLRQTTPMSLTLGLTNLIPAPTNGYECYKSGIKGDCDMVFYDSGFVFDVPDLTSCKTSPTISIRAVRKDDTTQSCVAVDGFSSTTKTVNLWSTYVTPATGSSLVSLDGTTIGTSVPGTGISLDFDANATANFSVNYPDAGQIQLDARYEAVVDGSTLVMLGADSFVAHPVGLCIYSDDASADCLSGDGSCSVFKKVDGNFNLKVKGVCWESSGDPDFCSGNPTTTNFQLASIPITHSLIAPTSAGVSSGNIGVSSVDISAVDNGEHIIANQTVSEVGVYTFTASPPNYFGTPLPVATSTNIGRFTPDHFVTSITNNGVFQDGCSGFTYSGQTFTYNSPSFPEMSIAATDSAGNTTVNYRDDFVKLTNLATQISMPAVTNDASNLGADGTTLLNLSWIPAGSHLNQNDDGTLDFSLGADQFTYTRDANALVTPFASDVRLPVNSVTDGDGIAATDLPRNFLPTGTEIRYGRMQLQNAYGPETLPLTIPVLTEYHNGATFVLNSLDSCTPYNSLQLGFSNYQGNLTTGDTTASGSGVLLSGVGNNLTLSVPGVGNDGSVDLLYDLDAAGLEWLKPAGNNPTAKATFGIFKGNNHLIYMRESIW